MVKNGTFMPGMHGPIRHDSPGMPNRFNGPFGKSYSRHAPNMPDNPGHMPQRNMPDFDHMRPHGPAYNNAYPSQRFQSDPDQMQQANRRMAAQRERELRNYHQEQQYNRSKSLSSASRVSDKRGNTDEPDTTVKTERSTSPSQTNEADRRELLARQHRALYGKDASMYGSDSSSGNIGQGSVDSAVQMPSRDSQLSDDSRRASVSATKVGMPSFGTSDSAPHSGARTATASPLASPAIGSGGLPSLSTNVGAIGSRLSGHPQSASVKPIMTPKERSASAASNPTAPQEKVPTFGAWGNSGVWGNGKGGLGVQASVWG